MKYRFSGKPVTIMGVLMEKIVERILTGGGA